MARDLVKIAESEREYQDKKAKGYCEHNDLNAALLYTEDILGRSVMPFIVIGDISKQIRLSHTPVLFDNGVHIVVLRRHYAKSSASIMESLLKNDHVVYEITDSEQGRKITFEYKSVPVNIYILNTEYSYFRNPDKYIYATTEFLVANPFDSYWQDKDSIIW